MLEDLLYNFTAFPFSEVMELWAPWEKKNEMLSIRRWSQIFKDTYIGASWFSKLLQPLISADFKQL